MNASTALPGGSAGRYAIYEEIGSGGMATVHLARRLGPVSFSRTVAIKRLHAHLARDPELVAMFLDEARVAARIRHPNVVPTLDVVTERGQPFLVMEYVQGESLARLLALLRQRGERISPSIACSIVVGMLHGLHAAHEATNDRGGSLGIVHRDVSPQNVMVGLDGVTRVLDFGVAKAVGRLQTTREGQIKGKLAYTAPELVRGGRPTRAADIYSTAVVFWEMLTGEHLFAGDNEASVLERVLFARVSPPSEHAPGLAAPLDAIVLRALEREPTRRFATANEMARAVETVMPTASPPDVGDWVEALAGEALAERAQKMARIEEGLAPDSERGEQAILVAESGELGDLPKSGAVVAGARESTKGAPILRAAIALAIAAGTVVLVLVLRHRTQGFHLDPGPAPSTPKPTFVAPSTLPSLSPEPPSNPSAMPPTVSADDLPAATSNPRHRPPPTAAPVLPSRSRAGGTTNSPPKAPHETPSLPPSASPQSTATPKPGCDPPWKIDANGIKQYKLDCL
jgi:serine/threonine-protein kinase